jgi:hypothetical protein
MDSDLNERTQRLGEVVEASTTEFTTQCYRLYEAPPLGNLVRCGDEEVVYGIVFESSTGSMDPARRPIARGEDEDSEEAVYRSNPQLTRLLLTEFRSLVVGHASDGRMRRFLAPAPPRIYSFVYRCDDEELREFSSSLDFLSILLSTPISAQDEVVAAFLRQASVTHPDPQGFLVESGKALVGHMGGQLQRLNNILRRLSP